MHKIHCWPFHKEGVEIYDVLYCQCLNCECIHSVEKNVWCEENPKEKYAHLDFCQKVAMALIAGFSLQKRKAASLVYVGPVVSE